MEGKAINSPYIRPAQRPAVCNAAFAQPPLPRKEEKDCDTLLGWTEMLEECWEMY